MIVKLGFCGFRGMPQPPTGTGGWGYSQEKQSVNLLNFIFISDYGTVEAWRLSLPWFGYLTSRSLV